MFGTSLEDMVVRLLGDGKSYETMINSAIGSTNALSKNIGANASQIQGISNAMSSLGGQAQGIIGMLAGGLGIGGFLSTIQSAISKAAETEQVEIAFKSLIGDADRAKTALDDLRTFAVNTPFELPQLLESAKSMLAFGEQAENIVPTMRRLGDVASALNIPLGQLTYLYGTLKSSGRVMTMDMRQFANRGIPIWIELAKTIGMVDKSARELTGAQSQKLQQMVTDGQITFDMIEKTFENMTSQGGRFFNMMEDQSHSFNGIVSNLKDSLGLLLSDIGTQIIQGLDLKRIVLEIGAFAKAAAEWFKNLNPNIKKTIFVLMGVVAAVSAITAAAMTLLGIISVIGFIVDTVGLPFLLIATAIVAAIALWVTYMGGIGPALDYIKTKAVEFWEWLTPIRQAVIAIWDALVEVGTVAWKLIKEIAVEAWNGMKEAMNNLFGDVTLTWTDIRDFIVDALLYVAYAVKNFGETWELTLLYAKMKAVEFFKKFLDYGVPVLNWINVFADAYQQITGESLGIPRLSEAFEQVSGLGKETADEFNAALDKSKQGFAEFKKNALMVKPEDIAKNKDMKDKGKKMGEEVGKGIKQGVAKEIQSIDAVLFGSAEHLRLLDEYLEKLNDTGKAVNAAGLDGAGGGGATGAANTATLARGVAEQTQAIKSLPGAVATDMCSCLCGCISEQNHKMLNELQKTFTGMPDGLKKVEEAVKKGGGAADILDPLINRAWRIPVPFVNVDGTPSLSKVPQIRWDPSIPEAPSSKLEGLLEEIRDDLREGSKRPSIQVEGAKIDMNY